MINGTHTFDRPMSEIKGKLKIILAGANCEITSQTNDTINFIHGTYMTQTPMLFRKIGSIILKENREGTRLDYMITTAPFITIWLTIYGTLFCWTVIIPILMNRILSKYPKKFMENMLAGI
jgi:hypothetical protein